MHHGTVVRGRHVPLSGDAFFALDRADSADARAQAASLAGQRVDTVRRVRLLIGRTVIPDGVEVACVRTVAATDAFGGIDGRLCPPHEIVRFTYRGCEEQMKVGRIDVVVGEDLVFGQLGEGRHHRGFSGPAFAADHGDLFEVLCRSLLKGFERIGWRFRRAGGRQGVKNTQQVVAQFRKQVHQNAPVGVGLRIVPAEGNPAGHGESHLLGIVSNDAVFTVRAIHDDPRRHAQFERQTHGELQVIQPEGSRFCDKQRHIGTRYGLDHWTRGPRRRVDDGDAVRGYVFLDGSNHIRGQRFTDVQQPVSKEDGAVVRSRLNNADFGIPFRQGSFGTHVGAGAA